MRTLRRAASAPRRSISRRASRMIGTVMERTEYPQPGGRCWPRGRSARLGDTSATIHSPVRPSTLRRWSEKCRPRTPLEPAAAAAPRLDRCPPESRRRAPSVLRRASDEGDLGVNAYSEQLLLPIEAVFQSPVLGAVRVHEQEQPAAVRQLVRLGTRLRLSDLGVGQRSRAMRLREVSGGAVYPAASALIPRDLPPKPLDGNAPRRTRLDADLRQSL